MSGTPGRPVVESLEQCINWFDDCVGRYGGSNWLERFAQQLAGIQLSSSFSGVGAGDIAMEMLIEGVRRHMSSSCGGCATIASPHHRNLFCVEFDRECQMELQLLPTPPEHLFGDILDFVNPRCRSHFRQNYTRFSYEQLQGFINKGNFVKPTAPCVLHGGCECDARRADIHIAGPPCVDFSSMSSDTKALQGPQLSCLMIWIALRMAIMEPFILHENVAGVDNEPIRPLIDVLSSVYIIQTCVFDSANLGHAAHRTRRLSWLIHKQYVVVEPSCPWPDSIERFFRDLAGNFTYHEYMIADEGLVDAE
eukprot:2030086-Pyramimonas_sp.AAC.1